MSYLVTPQYPLSERDELTYRLDGGRASRSTLERSYFEAGARLTGIPKEQQHPNRDAFELPDKIIVTPAEDGYIPDFGWHNRWGCWIVSEAFVKIVESLEPDLHEFIPFKECVDNKGKPLSKQFYLMNILVLLHALDVEKSAVSISKHTFMAKNREGFPVEVTSTTPSWMGINITERCFVLNGSEDGYHLWASSLEKINGIRTQPRHAVYFSEALYTAIQEANLSKLHSFKATNDCSELRTRWEEKYKTINPGKLSKENNIYFIPRSR